MPTYVYRREDGSTFEVEQRITEDALTVCPETGQTVQRVITGGTGLIFKGSGFYLTDYVRNGNGASGESAASKGSSESTSTAPASTKSASDAKGTAAAKD